MSLKSLICDVTVTSLSVTEWFGADKLSDAHVFLCAYNYGYSLYFPSSNNKDLCLPSVIHTCTVVGQLCAQYVLQIPFAQVWLSFCSTDVGCVLSDRYT